MRVANDRDGDETAMSLTDDVGEDDELESNSGIPCPDCEGSGCESCNETGYLIVPDDEIICPYCGGAGGAGWFVDEHQCGLCSGERTIGEDRLREYESGDWKPLYSDCQAARCHHKGECFASEIHPDSETFVYGDLSSVIFEGQDVSGRNFTDASVFRAIAPEEIRELTYEVVNGMLAITDKPMHSFVGADFTGAMMQRVDAGGSDFTRASLDNADLRQANLTGCVFTEGSLAGADLSEASLRGAILRDTNLAGANLHGADLTGAYLAGANLTGATIEEAASLLDARLRGATGLSPDQLARCVERGASFDDPERVPDWDTLSAAS